MSAEGSARSAAAPTVGLPAARFAAAFPFHVVFDRGLAILQWGRSLARLDPGLAVGRPLSSHFALRRPAIGLDHDSLRAHSRSLFLIEQLSSGIVLRGEIVPIDDATTVFLGSPWITDAAEIERLGLSFEDFAIHDPVIDMLQLVQAQRMAFDDVRRMTRSLEAQRSVLSAANEALERRNAELQQTQARLSEQEREARKLALVAARTADGVVLTDLGGQVEWINDGFIRISGYTLAELKGRRPAELLQFEGTDPDTVAYMSEQLRSGRGFQCEVLNRRKDGRPYWVSIDAQVLRDDEGRASGFMAIERDITELRAAFERAEDAERQLREAIEALEDGFVLYDSEDRMVLCNSRYRNIYRASRDLFEPGARFEDVIREGVRRGQYPEALGHEDQWIAERLAAHRAADSTVEQQLSDGRWLRIAERRTSDGGTVGFRVDVTELKAATLRAEEAARESARLTQQLDTIFQLSPDGFVAIRLGGKGSYANPAFFAMTDIEPEALQGLDESGLDALLATRTDPAHPYVPIAELGDLAADLIHLVRPRRTVLARSARLLANDGDQPPGRIVYLRDMTDHFEIDRMKSEFLSTAAHELRTPMASILGFSELMLQRDFDEATRRDLLQTIHRQSSLLVAMVNDLLDLARIEARTGRDLNIRPSPLVPMVRHAIDALMIPGDQRAVEFQAPRRQPWVEADQDKLVQALTNVLSNAYKYSPAGGAIQVRLRMRRAQDQTEAGITVRDHGIGMTPEQVARVFDRFYRADPSGTIPGTGLGMALVREIMTLMGGSVEIESAPGRGTEVTLWLRQCAPQRQAAEGRAAA